MNWEKHFFFFLFFGTEFFMGGWSYVGQENERYKGRNGKKRKEKKKEENERDAKQPQEA